jgi:hypothetical protein
MITKIEHTNRKLDQFKDSLANILNQDPSSSALRQYFYLFKEGLIDTLKQSRLVGVEDICHLNEMLISIDNSIPRKSIRNAKIKELLEYLEIIKLKLISMRIPIHHRIIDSLTIDKSIPKTFIIHLIVALIIAFWFE